MDTFWERATKHAFERVDVGSQMITRSKCKYSVEGGFVPTNKNHIKESFNIKFETYEWENLFFKL